MLTYAGGSTGSVYSDACGDASIQSDSIRQHIKAYVSIRQHTSAYVSIRQHTSAYVSVRQHTSAYVSIRQNTSAYVSIRQHTSVPTEASPSVKRSMRSLVLKNLRCRGSFRILFVRNCLKIWRWYIFSSIVPETSSLYTTGWYMLLHTRCYI